MDFLDTLKSAVGGGDNGQNNIQESVMDLLGKHGGNLNGLISQFSSSGLGEQVASWVGKGENLPVSSSQITNAIGGDTLQQISSKLGIDSGDLAGQLSKYLPMVIDKLTPEGSVPEGGMVDKGLDMLKGFFSK